MASQLHISNLRTLQSCKLCIICAKSAEAAIVKNSFCLGTKISGTDVAGLPEGCRKLDFYLGSFKLNKGSLLYYVTSASRQGIQSFASQAAILFSILKPKYAVHVGVCAAIDEKNTAFRCGDVVFGEKALNYEEGKWVIQNDTPTFLADVKTFSTFNESADAFLGEMERADWKRGDYISGCAVRMDAQSIFSRVKLHQLRNVGALEMEASAFLQVCEDTEVKAFGVIKGVSDMGDKHKGIGHDQHYLPALTNAAAATKAFVKWKLEKIEHEPRDISTEPGAVIVRGYFDNFIVQVIRKLLMVKHQVYVDEEKIALKGIRVVLPKDDNAAHFDDSTHAVQLIYVNHGMTSLILEGALGSRPTPCHVKGNYIFDCPTVLGSSLKNDPNQPEQIGYFKQALEELAVAHSDFVKVISWEEFEALSNGE